MTTQELIEQIPLDFFQRNHFLPLTESGILTIALCADSNREALEDIRLCIQSDFDVIIVDKEQIESGLRELLLQDTSALTSESESIELSADETLDLLSAGKDAPIIKLVNTLFIQAIQRRGTDIHIEPYEKEAKVRIRTDGELHEILTFPKREYSGVCARIKVMSKLNLAESRLPQDGRMRVKSGTRVIDVRISILPTQFGERIVMRILDRSSKLITLKELGLFGQDFKRMDELIQNPYGSILVTGPTGSGKSTTLYAVIEKIKSSKTNILTIEDPVEYQIDGIGQMPVNAKIGVTFANGLRSILRQDPDIIMVGEIRDPETAEIVTHASLTGHLVLSTLHTNDAPTAISRLVDMGVEKYLISSSLLGVIAQRLVRTLCPHCKRPSQPAASLLNSVMWDKVPQGSKFMEPVGCSSCLNTGFTGRMAIFELMVLDEEIKGAIVRSAEANVLRDLSRRKGMKTLLEDGREKAAMGFTTIDEITRAVRI